VLPKNIFALIVLYSTAAAFTQVLIDLGLSTAIIREAPPLLKDETTKHQAIQDVIMPSVVLRFLASVVICFLMMIFLEIVKSPLMNEFPELDIPYMILLAPICILFENGSTTLVPVFQVRKKFGIDSFLTSAASFLENVFTVSLYIEYGINQYFLGVLLAQSVIFFVRLILLKDLLKQFEMSQLSYKSSVVMLKTYTPFYIRRFFRFGLLQGEQLLVAILLPMAQLANFNLAKKISKYIKFYIEAFMNPLSIQISKTRDVQTRSKHVRTFLLITIPPPILLALLSPWIMKIAGGPKYADNWFILAILYISYVFYALSSLQFSVVTILGKHTDALYRDAIGSTIGFVSTLILILIFKENGLAWGQLISYIAFYIAGYQISKKYLNEKNLPKQNSNDEPNVFVSPDRA
jgi:O-antigen/teichoic acid export membrane protein